jgi:hypothetical protein
MTSSLINDLLKSDEPSIRWKIRTHVLGESPSSKSIKVLQEKIRNSPRVKTLLSRRDTKGNLPSGSSVYAKWQGAHWVLASLADIGYPPGDKTLFPARDRILDTWLGKDYYTEFTAEKKKDAYLGEGIPIMQGRCRQHASQQGNALYSLTVLGLENKRCDDLVERLLRWRWPDCGWNCDKDPNASHSSFTETFLPMKGLFVYSERKKSKSLRKVALQAAEVFLKRNLFRRISNGRIIFTEFTRLHYPLYWHYDILGALKAIVEMGLIHDPRCSQALDLLESKQLADGGWPAERSYYKVSKEIKLGNEDVGWGRTGSKVRNEWVSADALYALRAADRIKV